MQLHLQMNGLLISNGVILNPFVLILTTYFYFSARMPTNLLVG